MEPDEFAEALDSTLRNLPGNPDELEGALEFLEAAVTPSKHRIFVGVFFVFLHHRSAQLMAQLYVKFRESYAEAEELQDELFQFSERESRHHDAWGLAKFVHFVTQYSGEEFEMPLDPWADVLASQFSPFMQPLEGAVLDEGFELPSAEDVPPEVSEFEWVQLQIDPLPINSRTLEVLRCLEFDQINIWPTIVQNWGLYQIEVMRIVPQVDKERGYLNPMEAALYFRAERCIAYCRSEYDLFDPGNAKYYWHRILACADQFANDQIVANHHILEHFELGQNEMKCLIRNGPSYIFEWLIERVHKVRGCILEELAEYAIKYMRFDIYETLIRNGADTEYINVPARFVGGHYGNLIATLNERAGIGWHPTGDVGGNPTDTDYRREVPTKFETIEALREYWNNHKNEVVLEWVKKSNTFTRWEHCCRDEECHFRMLYSFRKKPAPAFYLAASSFLYHRLHCPFDPQNTKPRHSPHEILGMIRDLFSDRIPDAPYLKKILDILLPGDKQTKSRVDYIRRLGKSVSIGSNAEKIQRIYELVEEHERNGWELENHHHNGVLTGFTLVAPWAAQVFLAYPSPVITDATHTLDVLTILTTSVIDGENCTQILTITLFHRETSQAYICLFTPLRRLLSDNDQLTIIGDETKKIDKMIAVLFADGVIVTRKVCAKHKLDNLRKHWSVVNAEEMSKMFYATARGEITLNQLLEYVQNNSRTDSSDLIDMLQVSYELWGPTVGTRRGCITSQRAEMINSLGKAFSKNALFVIDRIIQFATKWHAAAVARVYNEGEKYSQYALSKLGETARSLSSGLRFDKIAHSVNDSMICSCGCLTDRELPCAALVAKMIEMQGDSRELIGSSWTVATMRQAFGCSAAPVRRSNSNRLEQRRQPVPQTDTITPIQAAWYSAQLCVFDTGFYSRVKDLVVQYLDKHILEANVPREIENLQRESNGVRHRPIQELIFDEKKEASRLKEAQKIVCERLEATDPKGIRLSDLVKFCEELATMCSIPLYSSTKRTRPKLWKWIISDKNWRKICPVLLDRELPLPKTTVSSTPSTEFHSVQVDQNSVSENDDDVVPLPAEKKHRTFQGSYDTFDIIQYIMQQDVDDPTASPSDLQWTCDYSAGVFTNWGLLESVDGVTITLKGLSNDHARSCYLNACVQTLARIDILSHLVITTCSETEVLWAQALLRIVQWLRAAGADPSYNPSQDLLDLWNGLALQGWDDTGDFLTDLFKRLGNLLPQTSGDVEQIEVTSPVTLTVTERPHPPHPERIYRHFFVVINPAIVREHIVRGPASYAQFLEKCAGSDLLGRSELPDYIPRRSTVDLPLLIHARPRFNLNLSLASTIREQIMTMIFSDQLVAGHRYRMKALHLHSPVHAVCVIRDNMDDMYFFNDDAPVQRISPEELLHVMATFGSIRGIVWCAVN